MPYTAQHKAATRSAIVEAARALFNRKGFADVTIDEVMASAGLTRGGFYNHFTSKADLFNEAVSSYQDIDPVGPAPELPPQQLAAAMIDYYLSDTALHSEKLQCPLYALPGDISRMGDVPRGAYAVLVQRTHGIFRRAMSERSNRDDRAAAITALLVGAMTMAKTLNEPSLSSSLRLAARQTAHDLLAGN